MAVNVSAEPRTAVEPSVNPPDEPLAANGQPAHVSRYRGVGIISTAPYQGVQVHLRPRYKGVRIMAPLMEENKPTPEPDSKREKGRWVVRKTPPR